MTNILSLIPSQSRKSSTTILIVDNCETDRAVYSSYLQSDLINNYDILEAQTLKAGLELWQSQHLDVVLIDCNLPDGNGLELLEAMGKNCPEAKLPVIMLTDQEDERIAVCAIKKGAIDYLVKQNITQFSLSHSIHNLLNFTTLNQKIAQLQKQENLIAGMALNIQKSLNLEDIYQEIVESVRTFLQVDRTVIYKFNADMSAEIVGEAVIPPWSPCLHTQIVDICFPENMSEEYKQGKIFVASDIYAANLTKCHLQLLESWQVRANLVVPILLPHTNFHSTNDKSAINAPLLWGLLIVHQCFVPRVWENTEISLMQQLSVQLAIAIQQSELQKNFNILNASLQQNTAERTQEVQIQEHKFRAIFDNTFQFTGLLTTTGILLEANQTALKFGGIKLEDIINRPFWEAYWWTISPSTQEQLQQAIAHAAQGEFIRYEVDVLGAGGQIATIDFSLRPLKNESEQVIMLIAEGRDITEAKRNAIIHQQAEQAFQESQILLQIVMDTLPMAIFWKDRNKRFLGCNQRFILDAGVSSIEEIIGKTDFDMVWREQAPLYQADDSIVIESGQAKFKIEEPFTKHGNIRRWLCTNKIPLHNPEGEIFGVLGSYEDITERKEIELALQDSEQRYATLAASVPVGIYRTDLAGNCLYVNDRWCEETGLTFQEAVGKGWKKALHPKDRQMVESQWQHLVQTGETMSIEYRFVRPDGMVNWVFGQTVAERDSEKKVTGYVGTITNITDRKQTVEALRRSEKLYRTLVDNFPNGAVVLFDHDLRYLLVGGFGLANAGLTKAQMEGKTIWEIYSTAVCETIAPGYQQALAGKSVTTEILYGDRLYLVHNIPVRNDLGQVIGGMSMTQDITERKQTEYERDQLLQALEAQNQTLETQVEQRTAELQQSKERFRNLVETSSDWIWEINEDGIYTYSSPQIINLLGYSPEEVLGKTPFDFMPPAQAKQVLKKFMEFVSVQAPFQCLENINRHQDGRLITLETSAVPIFDEKGQFRGYRGIDRDITARKQAEIALWRHEIRFQKIAANVPGVMYQYILHPDGSNEFIYISDRTRELYEIEPDTILQDADAVFQLAHPEDLPSLQESILLSALSLQQWSWEGRIITSSGHLKWIQGISQPQKQANGDILWDGLVLDISERARLEAERKQIEITLLNISDRLNLAIKSAQIGIWDLDLVNNSLLWDDRMYQLFGISPMTLNLSKEALAKFEALLHPDDRVTIRQAVKQAITEEKELDIEFRIVLPNGTIRILKGYGLVQRNSQGQPQRMIGINYDISDRKQAEAEIIRSRDLREAIFNESADALFLVDAETVKTIDCNQRAVEMFAVTNKTDLIGIEGHQLQKQQFTTEELQAIRDDMEQKGFWSREVEYKTFTGNLFWGNLAAKQITVAGQKMNLVRVTDISDRKQAETQLHNTNKQLARATRLKDEFLANMSHELRTPLNAILGITEGLQDQVFGVINQEQRQSLQTIERSGTHLLELINDILDLSKIEAGQMELDCTPVVIHQLCKSSLSFIKHQAFQKRIHIEIKIQPNLPELLVDERRMRQVLINLLNNAVKFTPEGGSITLSVLREQHSPETKITDFRDFIRIAVIDTGIGIAPENLHKLFQPFVQIDSSLNRQYTGTGLGLSLVKRIVEMHGGQVDVSSTIGMGSCFIVDLPFANIPGNWTESANSAASELVCITPRKSLTSPLILLAEDNEVNILTVSSYLEAKGYRILLAKNGQEVIALTKSHLPDLILMDIQMPGINGLEAMEQIRLIPNLANLPIIALTALAMPGDREKCLTAGANDYLTKPLKLKHLATTIQRLLEESGVRSQEEE